MLSNRRGLWKASAPAILGALLLPQTCFADVNDDFYDACDKGDVATATQLLDQGANVNALKGGMSALDAAADCPNSEAMVKLLISRKVDVNLQDFQGSSPLLHGCNNDHPGAVQALLDAGANPNMGSNFKRYPLMYAAKWDDAVIVGALLDHHADPNVNCDSGPPLLWAIWGDTGISEASKFNVVKLLLDHGADPKLTGVATKDRPFDGYNALIAALSDNALEIANLLLTDHADVNAVDATGETALMHAAAWNNEAMVNLLLSHQANVNAADSMGETALMYAAAGGRIEMAELLLDHGANIDAANSQGETALTYAGDRCHAAMVQLLRDKGAKRTDVHVFAGKKRPDPLTPAQSWGMAMAAFYFQKNGRDYGYLGGLGPLPARAVRQEFVTSWNIHNEADLLKELDDLLQKGHHQAYYDAGKQWAAMSDAAFTATQYLGNASGTNASRAQLERQAYLKWKEKDAVAWDLFRYVNLVNEGYACGYLPEDDAWELIHDAAMKLQQTFSSWNEAGENFLDGREIWAGKRDPDDDFAFQLLTNPHDPNNPWNQNPWQTKLSP
jgi:ankyrin repeat protein